MREMKKQNQDTSTIGGRLRTLRQQEGMTQEDLAEVLHLESKKSISHYENDRREIPASLLIEIADYFHTTTDYILRGTEVTAEKDTFLSEAESLLGRIKNERKKEEVLAHLKVMVEFAMI